eukprot:3704431-Alexandrium_andersonii.AAC.1
MSASLVGSEMCIRDSPQRPARHQCRRPKKRTEPGGPTPPSTQERRQTEAPSGQRQGGRRPPRPRTG